MSAARPERWGTVMAIGCLALPAMLFGVASVLVTTLGPPSAVWKWATGARFWIFATPVAGVLQLILWLWVPPLRWPGRLIATVLSLPTLLMAIYVALFLIGPRGLGY